MSRKPENKDELNIQELLKNSGVESMLDLNKLIGKIKKHFIESTLDAEFDEHMGYQKHDQNSRDVSNNYWVIKNTIKILEMFLTIIEKEKLRKQSQPIMEKLIFEFQEMNYQHLNQRLLKSMKEISLELKIKYFFYIQKECLQEIFKKQYIKCFIVI